jgi:hypothetical protein
MKTFVKGVLPILVLSVPSIAFGAQQISPQQFGQTLTHTGQSLGLTLSDYKYQEPSVDVKDQGKKIGIDYTSTLQLQNDYFFKVDGRFAYGKVDYTGSGTMNGLPDWYYDIRPLIGKDFAFNSYVLAPYAGFGYRHLYNDARGESSTGAWGYRRSSNYFYIPVGLTHRVELAKQSMLETTLEYDYLCTGKQVTRLGDVYEGQYGITESKNIENKQKNGYGLRASTQLHVNQWSFGPYVTYWKIKDSNDANFYVYSASEDQWYYSSGWIEPHNTTLEMGLKVSYSF